MRSTWLVHLYPRRWRRRFEDEFRALLEVEPLSPRLVLDVARGAVAAHRDPFPLMEESAMTRTRTQLAAAAIAALAVLPAAVFFAAGIARGLQPTAHEPSRTADAIVRAFESFPAALDVVLLIVAPAAALLLGAIALATRLAADAALRADLREFGAVSARLLGRPAFVLAALAVAASALILLFLGVHAIVG